MARNTKSNKIAIISPSGNFYGSERVLLDFLKNTTNQYSVYLPEKSVFLTEINRNQLLHKIKTFSSLPILYLELFFQLLSNKLTCIYANEGGHVRFIRLLARCFPKLKFIIHIRIIEDTYKNRLKNLPDNITLIAISDFIVDKLHEYNHVVKIYDPYDYQMYILEPNIHTNAFDIGVIGRVTKTKGIENAYNFFSFLDKSPKSDIVYQVNFYGTIEETEDVKDFVSKMESFKNIKIEFKGFIGNTLDIYSNTNCILHFNSVEPLGRIFFEAVNFKIPFIGFNTGGIGEIANELGMQKYVVSPVDNWEFEMHKILMSVIGNPSQTKANLIMAETKMKNIFNVKNYVNELEIQLY